MRESYLSRHLKRSTSGMVRGRENLGFRDVKTGEVYFPPRHFCPSSGSTDIEIIKASGRGTLHSYIISHLPAPGFTPPYAIAIVKLEEGPKMMCNIVECEQTPEALVLDMPLEVSFEKVNDEITLPQFKPAGH